VNINDPEALDRIEKAVGKAETGTSAELVVVVHPQSGSYLDRELLFGVGVGVVALAFLVFSPWTFHAALALADFLIAFTAGTWVCSWSTTLKGLVAGRRRREKNVDAASRVAYLDEGVGATKDRTGVLIFVSLFERSFRILADFGVEGRVGEAPWNRILREAGTPTPAKTAETVVSVIEKAGAVLAEALPPGEENPDEIPNRPRVLQ